MIVRKHEQEARAVSNGKARQGKAQPKGRWIRPEKRLAIYIRDGFRCLYCGTDLRDASPADVTLDHLVAKDAGGSNEADNLVTACRRCNCSRGSRVWTEFAPGGAHDRITATIARPLNIELARAIIAGVVGTDEW
jgi:hypothetical protein